MRQADVKALEHEGDELTREMIELLNTQYITPFDREDIYELATALDDVVDHIEKASDLLGLYKVQKTREEAIDNAACSSSQSSTWRRAVAELRNLTRVASTSSR